MLFRKHILRQDVSCPIKEPRIRPTDDALLPSLEKLEGWKVVRYAKRDEYALAVAGYFEVAKKNKKLRPIVDMRPLNAWLNTPPSVRLATMGTFLRTVAAYGANCFISSGDMSGWFHQLTVAKGCHNLFGIICGGVLFFYTVLGMGMSWYPLISQACLLCIMLMRMPGDKNGDLGVDGSKFGQNLPPGLIEMDRKRGFLVAYYDNVFILTKKRFDCTQWVARIKSNAKAVGAMWNPKEILCDPTQSLVFLGKEDREVGRMVDAHEEPKSSQGGAHAASCCKDRWHSRVGHNDPAQSTVHDCGSNRSTSRYSCSLRVGA